LDRISLARNNRADHGHPCGVGDVTQHLGSLDIHLLQNLLHMLNVGGAMLKQGGPMTQVGP
jgi:hypothetical protein